MKRPTYFLVLAAAFVFTFMICTLGTVSAQTFPVTVTDQTPTVPLTNPSPGSFQPRYISGFGQDNAFTVFFEDRDAGNAISFVQTTTGPTGFSAAAIPTDITDTHFCIKDWPINVGGTDYAYRAWGSVGNNLEHHFYVSNNLTNWILVSTFTIPNATTFTGANGFVYYGFHDVILLNGAYYAFAESNQSQTMIVRSNNGDDVWEAFASVGGRPGDGPLELPTGVSVGWTPSGSFVDLGYDRGYGKIYVDPRDNNFYLAINTAARTSSSHAALEAAFINPANWTWHDGTTGPASNPILSETVEHDLRECWVVPNTDPDVDWTIIYDADFGAADGGKALGYTALTPPLPPPHEVWVDDDWNSQGDVDGYDPGLIWQYNAFNSLQDGIDAVPSGTASERSIVNVFDGTYGSAGIGSSCEGFPGAILIKDLDYLTIQAVPGNEPVVAPTTTTEVNVVSIVVENSDHLIIDNIDSDQTVAQFDNWHFCGDDLTVRNSRFEGGEDGIDFHTNLTSGLIENNEFIDINTGNGDEVLDFTDASTSNVIIQDNYFKNNYRQITIFPPASQPASNIIIRRNIMDGTNSQEAIRLIGPSDIIVENNVIMNSTQQGIYIDDGCANITVHHNSFFNNGVEELRTKVNSSDIMIKNNIFYANGTYAALAASTSPLLGEDYNLIFNEGSSTESGSQPAVTLFGSNTITGIDPLFVSTSSGSENLHLQAGSPAIEVGTNLGVMDDIEKNPRPQPPSSNPDLGAYEHPAIFVEVALDIKPQSCPNPLNVKSKGVLPVAILGSAGLDVNDIDVSSILLEGVAPIRSAVEDVSTPLVIGEECECTTNGADGFDDLTLKFDTQAIAAVIAPVSQGDVKVLTLTGSLLDGTPIEGKDCVIIKGNLNKPVTANMEGAVTSFALSQNYPNPFNPKTIIRYQLPEVSHVTLVIYDIQGKEVVRLVNGKKEAGYHQVNWDARNYSSGTYFYKLTAGNFTQIKRMVLIK